MAKKQPLELPPKVEPGSLRARRLERLHDKGRLRAEKIIDTDTGQEKVKLFREKLDERVAVPSLAAEQDPENDEGIVYVWPENEDKAQFRYEVEKAWQAFASDEGLDVLAPELAVAIQVMTLPGRDDPTEEQAATFAKFNALRARFLGQHPEFAPDEEEE